MKLKHFLSQQFAGIRKQPTASPKRLNKRVRKFYPELSEMIELEIKQEKLQKLQAENKVRKLNGS
jgi:hypothetical protein